jgi:amidase
MFGDTTNTIYGRTRNPHDLSRITGGSSAGEAAIIAACGSAFGIGTDIGGSVRTPSDHCGIAGLKPTNGLVSDSGVLNTFPPANSDMNSLGPMARCVDDLSLVLDVISGNADARNPRHAHEASTFDASRIRVAYFVDNGISKPDDAVQQVVRSAAKYLQGIGLSVTEARPDCFSQASDIWWSVMNPDLGTTFRQRRIDYGKLSGKGVSDEYTAMAKKFLEWQDILVKQGRYSKIARYKAGKRRIEFCAEMLHFMDEFDVLVCPIQGSAAKEHDLPVKRVLALDDLYEKVVLREGEGGYTQAFNLNGWPAATVPIGKTDDGLPIGVQIAEPRWKDSLVLDVARMIEHGLGGWSMPEGI